MAAQIYAAQQFHTVKIFKDRSLGLGSYGAVYQAKADRLPCAAKLLHPILFQDRDPGAQRIQQRFEQECQFLSGIRHPNIVQYLGTCRDRESGLPALLMELMDESLTHFLENSPEPLPYHLEVNFSHDVALALDYLHSHDIVHRDLSSNNVLLIAEGRAKVTDFGMSKLLDTALHMTPQTQCPGTMGYMSPEALRTPPVYNKKLDCFSLGVLGIQIMTRQFPDPGPARQVVEDPRSPVGAIEMPVHERERRKRHIDLITPNHPLLETALKCLEYHERNRPSAQELCDQLATLKEDPQYTQSVQQTKGRGSGGYATAEVAAEQIAELQRSLANRDTNIEHLQSQLQEREGAVSVKHEQIQQLQMLVEDKSRIIEERERQVEENYCVIEERERQLRELNHQLQANEQIMAEFQQNLLQKERRIRDLEESSAVKEGSIPRKSLAQAQVSRPADITELNWKDSCKPPGLLSRNTGAITVDGSVVYIRDIDTMYAYNSQTDNWECLPGCPQLECSLAVVSGVLTAVGGCTKSGRTTNTLVSFSGEGSQRKWSKHFSPMPTKRRYPAVVCSGRSLVAAGGRADGTALTTVEIMNTDTSQWSVASSLPHPFFKATATVCGDNLYVLNSCDQTKQTVTCSLTALLHSYQTQSLVRRLKQTRTLQYPTVWRRLADLPVCYSTYTTFCGQLLAVGGSDDRKESTDAVYKYEQTDNTWSVISHMPKALAWALVAPLPNNKLIVCHGSDTYTASTVQQ